MAVGSTDKLAAGAAVSARYPHGKARSADYLRMTVAQMARHPAAFNPVAFAVWYEHVAACNPPLSAALDRICASSQALDDAAVLQLYREHIVTVDAEAVERIGQRMQQVMAGMSRSAHATGEHAGAFGEQLDSLAAKLAEGTSGDLQQHVEAVIEKAGGMKAAVQELQQQVMQGRGEIERLRVDLQRARDEALLDPLTGILNRKGFDHRLQALLGQPAGEVAHGLVMLDIDHFKQVNDQYGHLTGDRVLQAIGEILRHTLSGCAVPGHAEYEAARYGGEEFAILLPRTPLADCLRIAEDVRLRTRAMKVRRRDTQEVVLTVSVSAGVATALPGDDAPALIARADAALYASKNAGRDRVTCA